MDGTPVGFVLSRSTSSAINLQLTVHGEEVVHEGMLLIVVSQRRPGRRLEYLIRVENIFPVSELFSTESPMVLARREGIATDVSREVDRFYMVASASVLGIITPNGLEEPHRPPLPGDEVYLFDPRRDLRKIYGVEPGDPGVIWVKSILGYRDMPLALDIENITMHLGVFGITGSGKSYSVGVLIEKLSEIPVKTPKGWVVKAAFPIIVIDANADYIDYHQEFIATGTLGKYHEVRRLVFPNSRVLGPFTDPLRITLDEFTPRELAELIVAYKTGGIGDLPELQVAGLEKALGVVRERHGGFNRVFLNHIDALYDALYELAHGEERVIHPATERAVKAAVDKFYSDVIEKIRLVSDKPTIDTGFIDRIVNNPSLIIIDFSPEGAPGISLPLKQLIIGYLTRLLYNRFVEYKLRGEEKYLLLLIEEAQNYIPSKSYPVSSSVSRSYLSLIATQGRKFGLILGLISQRPSFVDPVVLSMVNTYFIFRIGPDDINYVMKLSGGLPDTLRSKITRLGRGTAIVVGQMNRLGFPVILKFEKRTVEHRMGTTHVSETLAKIYSREE